MEVRSIEAIIRALNDADVRYLIAGGVAVVAHGYVRFTADLDLILDLSADNLRRAVPALESLGYRPLVPVTFESFIDADTRAGWIRDKGLTVFSLHSPAHPATVIDLFVDEPLDFAKSYASAVRMEVASGLSATVVNLEDLFALKKQASRPKDMMDMERLRAIQKERAGE